LRDGKCGELLLFLIVEAVLRTPLIAHKIRVVSDNPKDQAKGSDGVFLGKYNGTNSLLIGEAKIHEQRSQGIAKALESINRFHSDIDPNTAINNELVVIRERLTRNLSVEQLKFLENAFDLKSEDYRYLNKVHPIVIVYDCNKISIIEKNCVDARDAELQASNQFANLSDEILPIIEEKLEENYKNLKKVHLDFFFIPITSVNKLRESFFIELHGMPYHREEKVDVKPDV
jgi:hypothetical protein